MFDKPERVRDYAKERAGRDEKYRALGYASYNAYEAQRTKERAKARNYPSVTAMKKHQSKVKTFTTKFLDKVKSVGFNFEEWIEDEDFDDTIYWELFRDSYGKGTPA